jgi:HTH-type transcriptional regulator, cell division transcriptional repressor
MTEETNWFTEDRATLGDRIAAAREAAGLSQAALATRLGVRAKTLDGWEKDSTEPRANRVQMLAAMLGVSLRWLLSGEGDGIPPNAAGATDARQVTEALEDLRKLRAQLRAAAEGLERLEQKLQSMQEHENDRK